MTHLERRPCGAQHLDAASGERPSHNRARVALPHVRLLRSVEQLQRQHGVVRLPQRRPRCRVAATIGMARARRITERLAERVRIVQSALNGGPSLLLPMRRTDTLEGAPRGEQAGHTARTFFTASRPAPGDSPSTAQCASMGHSVWGGAPISEGERISGLL